MLAPCRTIDTMARRHGRGCASGESWDRIAVFTRGSNFCLGGIDPSWPRDQCRLGDRLSQGSNGMQVGLRGRGDIRHMSGGKLTRGRGQDGVERACSSTRRRTGNRARCVATYYQRTGQRWQLSQTIVEGRGHIRTRGRGRGQVDIERVSSSALMQGRGQAEIMRTWDRGQV